MRSCNQINEEKLENLLQMVKDFGLEPDKVMVTLIVHAFADHNQIEKANEFRERYRRTDLVVE